MSQTDAEVKEIVHAAVQRKTGIRSLQLIRQLVDESNEQQRINDVVARWMTAGLVLLIACILAVVLFKFATKPAPPRLLSESPILASYVETLAQHIERVAAALPQDHVLNHLGTGSVSVQIVVKADGKLESVALLKKSGISALDSAALDLIRSASPLPQFPEELRKTTDIVDLSTALSVTSTKGVLVTR